LELIAYGAVGRATLAWMLGIDADSLDVTHLRYPRPMELYLPVRR
jgi:hypothetical protein